MLGAGRGMARRRTYGAPAPGHACPGPAPFMPGAGHGSPRRRPELPRHRGIPTPAPALVMPGAGVEMPRFGLSAPGQCLPDALRAWQGAIQTQAIAGQAKRATVREPLESILERRLQIQFAADVIWPYHDPKNVEIREDFARTPTAPSTGRAQRRRLPICKCPRAGRRAR